MRPRHVSESPGHRVAYVFKVRRCSFDDDAKADDDAGTTSCETFGDDGQLKSAGYPHHSGGRAGPVDRT